MSTLTRWEPFRELQAMREMMDRLADEPFFAAPQLWRQGGNNFPLALDVIEDDNHYTVKASLPGINPEDVEITLTDNVLTIKGEIKQESDDQQKNYHVRERRYGSFMRSITLPVTVNSEQVEATHENGVLTLTLPKTEAVKPKRIAVRQMVEARQNGQSNGHQE